MKAENFRRFTWHTFLVPVFFVWHVVNEYFALVPFRYIGKFFFYYLAFTLAIFLLGKLFLRKTIKAGAWATSFLIIFFFWGSAHDWLRSLSLYSFFVSYKFLLPVVFLFLLSLLIILKRKHSLPLQLHRFFNIVFGAFLLIEMGTTIYKLITNKAAKNDLAYYNKPIDIKLAQLENEQKPDIFFIVFDEYASTKSLHQYFNYDNSNLDRLLINNKFHIIYNSKSNYNSTPHSLATTLDLQYFNLPFEKKLTQSKTMLQAQYSIKKSLLPQFFKKKGYEIKNLGLMNLESAPAGTGNFFSDQMTEPLYLETLWGRIEKEIWWNVGIRLPVSWAKSSMKTEQEKIVNTNIDNLQNIFTELKVQSNVPKFVFGHVLMPHAPYFLNRHGEKRDASYLDYGSSKDSLYIDQLIYSNTWIDSLAKAAIKPFSRPRVIIIEGDHGNRNIYENGGNYIRERQFMNLNCWYFSDKNYSMLYDSISPVNTFRVILNKYFDANLPLLKDSTVFLY